MGLQTEPIARTQMLIRRPPAEVFNAFVDPAVTTKFWFTRGSGKLVEGSTVTWSWQMYGAYAKVAVKALVPNERILIEWPTPVEWKFDARPNDTTLVTVTVSGFTGTDDQKVAAALDSMVGFTLALAGCKAWLEHGVQVNLVADQYPDSHLKNA